MWHRTVFGDPNTPVHSSNGRGVPGGYRAVSRGNVSNRPNCDIGRAGSGRPLPDPTADLGTLSVPAQKSGGPDPKRNQPGDPRCGMHRLSSETQHPSRRLRLPRASCSKGAPSRHRKGRQPLHRRHSACFRLRRVAKRALSAAVSLPRPQRGRAGVHGVRRRPRPHRRR